MAGVKYLKIRVTRRQSRIFDGRYIRDWSLAYSFICIPEPGLGVFNLGLRGHARVDKLAVDRATVVIFKYRK